MDELRKLQKTELELMDEFVRVCSILNLEYFITCGTALGAVRHGGFIPWDDDMDIGMMRDAYEKFIEKAPALLGDKFYLEASSVEKDFNKLIIKLRNKNTVFKGLFEEDKHCNGIFIDIYAFDLLPESESERKKVIKHAQKLRWLHLLRIISKRPVAKGRSLKWRFQETSLRLVHPFLCVFSKSFWRVKMTKYITQWNNKNTGWLTCHFDSEPISMKMTDFFPLKKIAFEGKEYFIMNNTDEYLKQMYGDYMQIPPKESQITHMPEIIKFEQEEL